MWYFLQTVEINSTFNVEFHCMPFICFSSSVFNGYSLSYLQQSPSSYFTAIYVEQILDATKLPNSQELVLNTKFKSRRILISHYLKKIRVVRSISTALSWSFLFRFIFFFKELVKYFIYCQKTQTWRKCIEVITSIYNPTNSIISYSLKYARIKRYIFFIRI